MNHTALFTGRASAYAKGRPSYPEPLIDHLYQREGFSEDSVVADIGSGTGIFSGLLLEQGSTVFAVEPNADMRTAAEQRFADCSRFVQYGGTASHTGLPDHSADHVTAAQAFHWFDTLEFRAECRRILKPGGKVFLLWNIRDEEDPVNARCFELFRKYCPAYRGSNNGFREDDGRLEMFFEHGYDKMRFDNPLTYASEEIFLNRCLSSSYALRKTDGRYAEYLHALSDLYAECAEDGILKAANYTVLYKGAV